MKVTIHYFRHGESVANVVQNTHCAGSLAHLLMLDPNLTERGKKQSSLAAQTAPDVDIVLSSELLRAIHTAVRTYPKKTVHIVPHVKELGYGLDNVPISHEYQLLNLNQEHRNLIVRSEHSGHAKSFIDYLKQNIAPRFKHKDHVTVALFTHSRYMKKTFGLKSMKDVPNNGILTKTFHTKV